MAVIITKPEFNLRDKVSELDRPVGAIGTQILKTNTLTEFARAAHIGRRNFLRNGAMEVWQRGNSFNNIYNKFNPKKGYYWSIKYEKGNDFGLFKLGGLTNFTTQRIINNFITSTKAIHEAYSYTIY